jgi:riboflavin synthase
VFTGLIEETGVLHRLERCGVAARLVIRTSNVGTDAKIGDSIATNGCCLTVVQKCGDDLEFDVGSETLLRTNLGQLTLGSRINLERALRVGDRLGGHYVTGHVDGLGEVTSIREEGEWRHIRIAAPLHLLRQMASKGSVAIDGVSLTLVDVDDQEFSVMLVPHTLAVTTLGELTLGRLVNLETDVLAKYVERQLRGDVKAWQ